MFRRWVAGSLRHRPPARPLDPRVRRDPCRWASSPRRWTSRSRPRPGSSIGWSNAGSSSAGSEPRRPARRPRGEPTAAAWPVFSDLDTNRRAGGGEAARPHVRRRAGGAAQGPPGDVRGTRRRRRRNRQGVPLPTGPMIALFRTYLAAIRRPARPRHRPAARPGDRQPLPAGPQRRHHQQRRRHAATTTTSCEPAR